MAKDKQTSLRLSEESLLDLDQLRRAETDLPTRAEMIRRLIERGVGKIAGKRDDKLGTRG